MKKLLALVFLIAAAAGGPDTSLAGGSHGGGHGRGGFHGHAGPRHGGFHGNVAVLPSRGFHNFPGRHGYPYAYPYRRSFVAVGVGFPLAYYSYPAYYGGYPAGGHPAGGYVSPPPVSLYCQNPMGYYPQVQICPSGWLQVTQ